MVFPTIFSTREMLISTHSKLMGKEHAHSDLINSVSYIGILSQLMNAVLMDCHMYSVMSLAANTSFAV